MVSRTDSIKIHLVDTDAVKPTVSLSLTEFSTVNWFCSQGTRSGAVADTGGGGGGGGGSVVSGLPSDLMMNKIKD